MIMRIKLTHCCAKYSLPLSACSWPTYTWTDACSPARRCEYSANYNTQHIQLITLLGSITISNVHSDIKLLDCLPPQMTNIYTPCLKQNQMPETGWHNFIKIRPLWMIFHRMCQHLIADWLCLKSLMSWVPPVVTHGNNSIIADGRCISRMRLTEDQILIKNF